MTERRTAALTCPYCQSARRQVKHGHRASGAQIYECRVCERRYTPQCQQWRAVEDAQSYTQALGLRTRSAWRAWVSSGARPPDIPSRPDLVYGRLAQWPGWEAWLGYDKSIRTYDAACAYVQSLGLRNSRQYALWSQSAERPADIPIAPNRVYARAGQWKGWGHFLGSGNVEPTARQFRPFLYARLYVRGLGLPTRTAHAAWAQSAARPDDIPSDPEKTYSRSGDWTGWSDYLGSPVASADKGPHDPYLEARAYVRTLGLASPRAYRAWARTAARPLNIPRAPDRVYARSGTWLGWYDFLGRTAQWRRQPLLEFLSSLRPVLKQLSQEELYVLLRESGVLRYNARANMNAAALDAVSRLPACADPQAVLDDVVARLSAGEGTSAALPRAVVAGAEPDDLLDQQDAQEPARTGPTDILETTDRLLSTLPDLSAHVIAFFTSKALAKLWARVFRANSATAAFDEIASYCGADYANRVRDRFLFEWNGAASITPPRGYDFRINGHLVQPNLMQRLLAHRLKEERRIGNWSAPGAGKTLGAILASRVVDSRLTVVVAANNTLDGWEQEIRAAWPDSVILTKERGTVAVDRGRHTYLLLNYEAFQQHASAQMIERLAADQKIDMLVLDEVHNVKQRGASETKRRRVLADLLERAGARNAGLYVLGMSATPVINSLDEGASLLQMVLGASQDDLETTPTIDNAIRLHERLVIHGVRYRPDYRQDLKETTPAIDGTALAAALDALPRHRVLPLEQTLLDAKLDAILAAARPGTVIYTHYVEGIVDVLRARLEAAGLRTVEFTGRSKVGLDLFKARQADVLIGSATVREGVDGLQHVSNRVIVASLPWTHAAYEQLIGRFWRQGSAFDRVDVIVPQVVVGQGAWSWDRERMARVRYKKTLGAAALDGVIPEGVLESEQTMLQRSLQALHAWIAHLEQDHQPAGDGAGAARP